MTLSRDAREALSLHFPEGAPEATLELEVGLDANWGQTLFSLFPSGCWALTRASYSDPWTKILMDPSRPFTLKEWQYEDTLTATAADGRVFPLNVYPRDVEAAQAFCDAFAARAPKLPPPAAPAPPPKPGKKAPKASPGDSKTAAKPAPLAGVSGLDPAIEPLHDPADPVDEAGNSMQNFFERVIARVSDAPVADEPGARKVEQPSEPPSPEFISLVDTGDVFARMPSKRKQAIEAYLAAWERRHDGALAVKLAALFEQQADPETRRLWLERAVDALPPGKERDRAGAHLIDLLLKTGASAEVLESWRGKLS